MSAGRQLDKSSVDYIQSFGGRQGHRHCLVTQAGDAKALGRECTSSCARLREGIWFTCLIFHLYLVPFSDYTSHL